MLYCLTFICAALFPLACSNPPPPPDPLARPITPGDATLETASLSKNYHYQMTVHTVSGGQRTLFRRGRAHVEPAQYENRAAIHQRLQWLDPAGTATGRFIFYSDPQTLEIWHFEYQNQRDGQHFAIVGTGNRRVGTQDLNSDAPRKQEIELTTPVFNPEVRAPLLRSVNARLGDRIRLPLLSIAPPHIGWVSYVYKRDEQVQWAGEQLTARVWETPGEDPPRRTYWIIDEPPYATRYVLVTPDGDEWEHQFAP